MEQPKEEKLLKDTLFHLKEMIWAYETLSGLLGRKDLLDTSKGGGIYPEAKKFLDELKRDEELNY